MLNSEQLSQHLFIPSSTSLQESLLVRRSHAPSPEKSERSGDIAIPYQDQGRINPPEVGRGHATPIEPVQRAKCWQLLLKIEPSLSLKPAQTPSKMGQNLYNSPKNSRAPTACRLHSCLCHPPTRLVLF